jgi:fluoroacetyl-CoA thioesterase
MTLDSTFSMRLVVTGEMTARFFGCEIHPLYATFAVVEHCEYASRQVIRPFLAPDQDAVGSAVQITHRSGVPVGALVTITARLVEVDGGRIVCAVEVRSDDRVVADGTVEQRVMPKEKLQRMIAGLYADISEDKKRPTEGE